MPREGLTQRHDDALEALRYRLTLILMQNAIFSTTGPSRRQQPGEQVGNLRG